MDNKDINRIAFAKTMFKEPIDNCRYCILFERIPNNMCRCLITKKKFKYREHGIMESKCTKLDIQKWVIENV